MKQLLAVAAMVLGLATPAHATEWIICGDGEKKVTFEILVGMMDYLSIYTVRMEANGKLWSSKDEPGATPVYVAQAFEADDHMMVDIAGDGGAVIASLRVFEDERTLEALPPKIDRLRSGLAALKSAHPCVHDVRQCGMVAGIELRQPCGTRFPAGQRMGELVCSVARGHGLLTRPILDTIVVMPPLCVTCDELDLLISALESTFLQIPALTPGG